MVRDVLEARKTIQTAQGDSGFGAAWRSLGRDGFGLRKIERGKCMKVSVCVGSACHLKGSRAVLDRLHQLVRENGLEERVRIASMFCIGKCQQGVCVMVDDSKVHSVGVNSVDTFFQNHVLGKA